MSHVSWIPVERWLAPVALVSLLRKLVRKALGPQRSLTPHALRHTFPTLHLSRGTNPLWVQRMGGWRSAVVVLDTYTLFLPSELSGTRMR